MDRGARWATVCGVEKGRTRVKRLSMHSHRKLKHPALQSDIRCKKMLDSVRLPVTRDRSLVPK